MTSKEMDYEYKGFKSGDVTVKIKWHYSPGFIVKLWIFKGILKVCAFGFRLLNVGVEYEQL